MKVIITSAARSDLAAIGDYIARDNPERAASFVEELVDRCEDLASMAERFQLAPRYALLGVRRRPYKGYLIFYRVTAVSVLMAHAIGSDCCSEKMPPTQHHRMQLPETNESQIRKYPLDACAHRTSSRIARSSPSRVSGYMRLAMSWRTMRIDMV